MSGSDTLALQTPLSVRASIEHKTQGRSSVARVDLSGRRRVLTLTLMRGKEVDRDMAMPNEWTFWHTFQFREKCIFKK